MKKHASQAVLPALGRGVGIRDLEAPLYFSPSCASLSGATKIVPVEAGPPETGAADPEATAADLAPRRGYQEYAIQQTAYEQPMKSSR